MKKTWKDRIRAAFTTRDAAAFETELEKDPTMDEAPEDQPADEKKDEPTTDEAHEDRPEDKPVADAEAPTLESLCAHIEALEAKLAAMTTDEAPADEKKDEPTQDEAPAEEEEKKESKTTDSASIFARAEILSPGIQFPTHVSAATPKKSRDSLCALKRRALDPPTPTL